MTYIFRYLRHSEEVAKQPYSRQAQLNAIDAFIATAQETDPQFKNATVLPEFFDADISGGIDFGKRPAGGVLLGRVAKGDIIIADSWDRMFRDCRDAENTRFKLKKLGVRLICLDFQVDTSTAMGDFAARIMIAKGELERTQTSERIKSRLKVLKYNKGVSVAYAAPLGWKRERDHEQTRKDGRHYTTLKPDRDERMECEYIRTLREKKKMTFGGIAMQFNNNGRKMKRTPDLKWTYRNVQTRYLAAVANFPCGNFDRVTGQNSEQLMVPVEVPE